LCEISIHEAAEGADFPKLDPNSVGVAGGVAKIKVAYSLEPSPPVEDFSGVYVAPATLPLEVMPEQKNRTCFYVHRI